MFVPIGQGGAGDPIKICRLRLTNQINRPKDSSQQRGSPNWCSVPRAKTSS